MERRIEIIQEDAEKALQSLEQKLKEEPWFVGLRLKPVKAGNVIEMMVSDPQFADQSGAPVSWHNIAVDWVVSEAKENPRRMAREIRYTNGTYDDDVCMGLFV